MHPYRGKAFVRVPPERLGVVIGEDGRVKKELEKATATRVTIDNVNSGAIIEPINEGVSPLNILKAQEVIRAMALCFSPEKAFRLLDEGQLLVVIDLREVTDSPNHLTRIKGRIIGEAGKTRRIIEEATGTYVCVGEGEVAIIGGYEETEVARRAIEMLIEGRPHAAVYKFLEREARRLKRRAITGFWERVP